MLGADGIPEEGRIMESLRGDPPKQIGGAPVRGRVLDY